VDASLVGTAPPPTGAGAGAASASASVSASASTTIPGKKKKVPLNGGDRLFSELRDLNFAVVGGLLNKVAKRINADYEERHNAKTMPQIRQFISKMGGLAAEHQSLRLRRLTLQKRRRIWYIPTPFCLFSHIPPRCNGIDTSLAEQIMDYTMTDDFNKILEVQQSKSKDLDTSCSQDFCGHTRHAHSAISPRLLLF